MKFIIHSMGHCGTRTIKKTLEKAGYPVLFGHSAAPPYRFDEKAIETIAKNDQNVFVIIPIRRPSYRNLSAFYGNPEMFKVRNIKKFLRNYPHNIALQWMDSEVRRVWGVDVYQKPFDKKKGWQVYSGKILVIRACDLSRVWADAFKALTGKKAPKLYNAGIESSDEYLDLKNSIPAEYIERMQASKYYQHFFQEREA